MSHYDVAAVGNAIIDILRSVDDAFIEREGILRNSMTLIDEERADHLTRAFGEAVTAAGGSAANTVTGVASFGGSAAYMGKVAGDALGQRFADEFAKVGVTFRTRPLTAPPATARSLIAVSQDGHRSMNTYLGASSLLGPEDIDADLIANAKITFLEGYLFDRDDAKQAFVKAAELAHAAERKVSLTLSDSFCVERHRASFRQLVAGHIDILFANEHEILSLYEMKDLGDAFEAARTQCPIVCVTRSEKGSIIAAGDERIPIEALKTNVVDTTGAGDLYAAGFLFGYSRNRSLKECGALASLAAAEVISHMGPRPEASLRQLAAEQWVKE
jgi:sugar/nucleoside kinase (ribokinase family)